MCSSSGTNRVLDIVKSNGYVENGGNVQIYVNDDPIAQEWLILGSGTSEFILLPRSNMNLALTAYPSAANGTSSGTTSTSAGNIYVSTYSATNNYQKWHLVENGEYVEIENATLTIVGSDNVVVNSTLQLTAVTTPSSLSVTWSSSSTSVATVSSSGLVTGLRAGKTTITATYTDPATGETTSATKTVYVRIANGVYYLQNLNSGYYLHTKNGYINDQTDVYQYSKYADSTSTVTKLRQQWKIYYLGSVYYSIRPMHRLNMGLHADFKLGDIDIINIGTADTTSGVPNYCRWTIEMYSTGWIIRNEGSDSRALQIAAASTSSEAIAIASTCTLGSLNNRWAIVPVTSSTTGTILYDTTAQAPATGTLLTKYVAPEETRTLSDMSLLAVAYSPNSINQTFRWSSSNTSVATVNSSTGAVTGVSSGTVTITGKWAYNTSYTVSYTLNVTEIANDIYFLISRDSGKYVQPDDNDAPNYTTSGSIMEQMSFDRGLHQKWIFTHTGDGYYKITSRKNGYAITVPTGSESSQEVNLILTSYTGSSNQKWSVTLTANGSYKIKAKSAESASTDLIMGVEISELGNLYDNLNIQQNPYIDNTSYKDEWYLERMKDASLVAIEDTAHDMAHNAYFSSVHSSLSEMGYDTIEEYYDDAIDVEYDGEDLLDFLCSSEVLTLMTHGEPTKIKMSNSTLVDDWSIMGLPAYALVDLELVVLLACYTGQDHSENPSALNFAECLHEQGAENVIAFKDKVACIQAIPWIETFFESLADGKTYEDAMKDADAVVNNIPYYEETDKNQVNPIYTTDDDHRVYLYW